MKTIGKVLLSLIVPVLLLAEVDLASDAADDPASVCGKNYDVCTENCMESSDEQCYPKCDEVYSGCMDQADSMLLEESEPVDDFNVG